MAQCKHCGAPHDMTGKGTDEPVICGCGAMVFTETVVQASRGQDARATNSNSERDRKCPRCGANLVARSEKSATAYDCRTCGGIWLSVETFNKICTEKNTQSAAKNYVAALRAGAVQKSLPENTPKYLPCPHCKQQMNRRNFAEKSGVIIDICAQDGVWLDKQELSRIVTFIEAGGMQNRPDALIDARSVTAKPAASPDPVAAPELKESKSSGWEAVGAIASVGFLVLEILSD